MFRHSCAYRFPCPIIHNDTDQVPTLRSSKVDATCEFAWQRARVSECASVLASVLALS